MRSIGFIFVFLLCGSLWSKDHSNYQDPQKQRMYVGFGYESGFLLTTGYSDELKLLEGDHRYYVDFGFLAFGGALKNLKLDMGLRSLIYQMGNFALINNFSSLIKTKEGILYSATNFSVDESILLAYLEDSWFVGLELGYQKYLLNHMEFSDRYKRDEYYPGVEDGWYRNNGGKFYYGVQLSHPIRSVTVSTRLGFVRTEDFAATEEGFYLSTIVNFGF